MQSKEKNLQMKITDSRDLLMISLSKFYSQKKNIEKLVLIIDPKSAPEKNKISLRLVDWFITNYSKKYNIVIPKQGSCFNVYLNYRSQLKAYSKQLFDPFRRRDRITFVYDVDKSIETTIGQLNMFRWILQNNILEYIQNNLEKIENDMITCQKQNVKNECNTKIKLVQTDNGIVVHKRKTRNQLSKNAVKNMNVSTKSKVVSFE